MMIARTRPHFIAGLVALSAVLLAAWALSASPLAAAVTDAVLTEPPVLERSAGEESDDPFHVSDESLAAAIFIPGIFLLATGATVGIALSKRGRDGEDDDDE